MDELMDDEPEAEESSPLKEAASEAFPDTVWDENRLAALKELIHLCSGKTYDEDAEEEKPKSNLAVIFGAPKPKRSK